MEREEALSYFLHQNHGAVPTFLYDTSLCSAVTGISTAEIFRDNGYNPELAAKAIAGSMSYLGHDMSVGSLKTVDYRVFGSEMRYKDNAPMMTVKRAFEDPTELYRHTPEESDCQSQHAYAKGVLKIRELKPDAIIAGTVPAPFSVGCMLRGLEPMLMDVMSEPDYVKELLTFAGQMCSIIGDIMITEGDPDFGIITGAFDNPDLIHLDSIRELCLPGVERQFRIIDEHHIPKVYHPHGHLTKGIGLELLDDYQRIGFDCLYYGENNEHSSMRELCSDRFSLMGGVDTFTTIYIGDDDRVVSDTRDVLTAMKGIPFVFSCSCSVDGDLDVRKMKMMIDTVRSFSD